MLMSAGEFNDLRHFCFRNLVGEHAANTHAMTMDMQHDLHRFLARLAEEPLQDVHDELHRRVIVVQQKNFVEAGLLVFGRVFVTTPVPDAVVLARWPDRLFFRS